jgi:hypothetical protein
MVYYFVLFPAVFRGFSCPVPRCPVSASFASGFVLRLLAPHCMRVFFLGSYAGFNPASCSIWVVYLRWLLFDPCGSATLVIQFLPSSSYVILFLPRSSYSPPLGEVGRGLFSLFLWGLQARIFDLSLNVCACTRVPYIYLRTCTYANLLCFIASFPLFAQKTPKIFKKHKYW